MNSKEFIVSKITLETYIIFALCIEPPIFQKVAFFAEIDLVYDVLGLLCVGYCFLKFANKRYFIKSHVIYLVLLMGLFATQVIATIVNGGEIKTSITSSLITITPCMWMLINEEKVDDVIKVLKRYLYVLVFSNIISIILYPRGLFVTVNMWNVPDPHWVLSLGNSMAPYILTTALLATISMSYKENFKEKIVDIIAMMVCILTPILVDCATLTGGIFLYIGLYIIQYLYKHNVLKSHMNLYVIISVGLFFLIVIFRKMDMLSFIIETILQRDITLTSRLRIWDKSLEAISKQPILGYGFLNMYDVQNKLLASHQHNYYLHLLFQGGMITFAFFVSLLNKCRSQLTRYSSKISNLVANSLFCYLVIFITEVYGEGTYIIPFYLVISMALLIDRINGVWERDKHVFDCNALL